MDTTLFNWEHKYRPGCIKDVILPQDYKNFFNKIVAAGASTNLLLASLTPGTGKTTVALAIATELGAEYLLINASDERGIDTIREKIVGFASTAAFNEKVKLIILDEADELTPEAQDCLRSYVDKYQDNCRFIFTCNYVAKIIPALREKGGRLMEFIFDMNKAEYKDEVRSQIVKRMSGILKHEGIPFEAEAIEHVVDKNFPSVRSIVTQLQKISMIKNEITYDYVKDVEIGDELTNLILGKHLTDARKYISERCLDYTTVFRYFMESTVPKLRNPGDAILNIGQYEYQCAMSSDPSIQIACCIVSLFSCI